MARQGDYLHAPDALFLPWVKSANDRRFKRILIIVLVFFGLISVIVPFLPTPEIVKSDLQKVSPRITKLILERKKLPPPPVIEKKKPEKKEPEKKPKEKEVKKKQVEKKKSTTAAYEKASKSGLVALSGELAELTKGFDLPVFDDKPLKHSSDIKEMVFNENLLTSKAKKSSGGVNTAALSRTTGASKLTGRTTTVVTSSIKQGTSAPVYKKSRNKQRDKREIEQVFQMNKGAIYSIYNRALRKDPTLQGKVIVELTISSQGVVTQCRVVSSDLNDAALERKIVSRIKLFKFKAGDVPSATVNYPIDFFPS